MPKRCKAYIRARIKKLVSVKEHKNTYYMRGGPFAGHYVRLSSPGTVHFKARGFSGYYNRQNNWVDDCLEKSHVSVLRIPQNDKKFAEIARIKFRTDATATQISFEFTAFELDAAAVYWLGEELNKLVKKNAYVRVCKDNRVECPMLDNMIRRLDAVRVMQFEPAAEYAAGQNVILGSVFIEYV